MQIQRLRGRLQEKKKREARDFTEYGKKEIQEVKKMIKIEKKGNSLKVTARGGADTLINELAHVTASILNSLIEFEKMSEEDKKNFWDTWINILRLETEKIREKIDKKDPNIINEIYTRRRMPWE